MTSWLALPLEIQEKIICYAEPMGSTEVCSYWNRIAQKYMYRLVVLEDVTSLGRFLNCIKGSHVGFLVRYLVLSESLLRALVQQMKGADALISLISRQCPNIIRLSCQTQDNFRWLANRDLLARQSILDELPQETVLKAFYAICASRFPKIQQVILLETMSKEALLETLDAFQSLMELKVIHLLTFSQKTSHDVLNKDGALHLIKSRSYLDHIEIRSKTLSDKQSPYGLISFETMRDYYLMDEFSDSSDDSDF
ncbi:hypothetical protein BY458DRAFT_558897 [Sporodiniella umbellata]|nr:hypothetical protein BY458DRAFT_558897 [Sporodiniella umbellata]